MKVLFLDIDGVLNSENTTEKVGVGLFKGFIGLDAGLVKLFLDWRAVHPDVKIVISSTWRLNENLLDLVRDTGIPYIDVTRSMKNRATEVDDWLGVHPEVTHYGILDDIQQFSDRQRSHFVKTSYTHGLREKDLRAMEVILGL